MTSKQRSMIDKIDQRKDTKVSLRKLENNHEYSYAIISTSGETIAFLKKLKQDIFQIKRYKKNA